MRALGRWAADILLPPRCPACRRRRECCALCPSCLGRIPRVHSPLCSTCGSPFETVGADHDCSGCLSKRPHFASARACADYDTVGGERSPLAAVLHRYKYDRDVTLARPLGRFLADNCPLLVDHDLLIPVPLHLDRLRWRGFNQSLLLAKPLAARAGRRLDPFALERTRATPPQVGLGEPERRRNIAGAFAVRDRAAVNERTVLLVDDVYTTGATANECARTLRRGGARRVDVLVLARARAGRA